MREAVASERALLLGHVSKRFGGVVAVDDFSLVVPFGQVVGLVGPNGCGKTTLLNVITGVVKGDSGEVWLDGERIVHSSVHRRARAGVVRLFQEPRAFGSLTVAETVSVADHRGVRVRSVSERVRELVREFRRPRPARADILAQCNLEAAGSFRAEQLSFGQKRLLGLAATVTTDAKVLLFDEPTSGLSPGLIPLVAELIRRLVVTNERAILVVEHNLAFLRQCSDRCVMMQSGRNVAEGDPLEILKPETVRKYYLRAS